MAGKKHSFGCASSALKNNIKAHILNAMAFGVVDACKFLIRCRNVFLDCFTGMKMTLAEAGRDDTENAPRNTAEGVRWLGALWLATARMIAEKDCSIEDVQELQDFAIESLKKYILDTVAQEGLEVACDYLEEGLWAIKERVEVFNSHNDPAKIVFDFGDGTPSFLKLHKVLFELSSCNIHDSASIDFGDDIKTPSQIMNALAKRAASCNSAELRQVTRALSFLAGCNIVCEEAFLIVSDVAHMLANRVKLASLEEKSVIVSCLDAFHDNLQIMSDKLRMSGEAGLIQKIKSLSVPDEDKSAFRPEPGESGLMHVLLTVREP